MAIQYLDPSAEEGVPVESYEIFLDTERRPLTIGLLANAFPDAGNFLDRVEEALAARLPGAEFRRYQKPNVLPVDPEELARITAECDGLVAAWGH